MRFMVWSILRGIYGFIALGAVAAAVVAFATGNVAKKADGGTNFFHYVEQPFIPLLFFLLGTGLIAWKGIPELAEKYKAAQEKSGGFESTGEDDYSIYEDDEKYVFAFVLRKANSLFLKTVKGRFVEITDTALTISAPYPLTNRNRKQQSLGLYKQDTWRKAAKTYDRSKITGVRMYTEQFEKDQKKLRDPHSDKVAYVVTFDYGNKAVDINYHLERDIIFEIPWSQFHEQSGLSLHKAFTHALNEQRPYNPVRTIHEDLSVSGGLPEADDMVSRILAREEKEGKQKDDDMPDPF